MVRTGRRGNHHYVADVTFGEPVVQQVPCLHDKQLGMAFSIFVAQAAQSIPATRNFIEELAAMAIYSSQGECYGFRTSPDPTCQRRS